MDVIAVEVHLLEDLTKLEIYKEIYKYLCYKSSQCGIHCNG